MKGQTPLQIIHWEYNQPAQTAIAKEFFELLPIQQKYTAESKKKGIKIRFTYRITLGAFTAVSYIAEFSFVHTTDEQVEAKDIEKAIEIAYFNYTYEFDERKRGTLLQHNSLKNWHELTIDLESIFRLLRES